MIKANITEIFFSKQGEGLLSGKEMIFIRFAGCNIRCNYCDTPYSLLKSQGKLMDLNEVLHKIIKLSKKIKGSKIITLTGGEPLLQVSFIEKILKNLHNYKIHLETSGILYDNLKRIYKYLDWIAMDIKLPSATGKNLWEYHRKFLKISPEKTFIKIVITNKTNIQEIKKAVDLIKNVDENIPLFLQIVSPIDEVILPPDEKTMERFYSIAKSKLKFSYISAQMHKIFNWR